MNRYPRYPQYKDSGVEWIGEVPAHWDVIALKRLGTLKGGTGFPPDMQGRSGNELPFYKVGDLSRSPNGITLGETEHSISRKEASILGATIFPANVLVWAKIGAALLLNRRRIVPTASCLDNNMTGFIPNPSKASTKFCFYLLSSIDFSIHAKPGAVPSFSEGDQGELHVTCPSIAEQSIIADFLDRETARIDALIAKKTRFIELLKEKRAALITHAVTKGLDPEVKMKDSGVEWIGEVAEHWEVLRLASIGHLMKANGGNRQDDADSGIPCIRYGDLYTTYDFLIRDVKTFISNESVSNYTPIQHGDLLFAASGETFEEIGKSAVNLAEGCAYCGGDIIVLRPQKPVNPVFLGYATGSSSAQAQKSMMGKGFTVIHLYGDQLRNVVIAVPPEPEQKVIGDMIETETARIDAIIGKVQESIDLLKERRSALITAAVTGKVDVRGLVPNAIKHTSREEKPHELGTQLLRSDV
ncbi:restriction endonuclease subunit S [Sulfobacillus harzensis]|uniref:Type I restriction modification DNA specificity domain-containing protein n=1 Tax=Sulfobacillus harzensis TaxID=2729629 RepID=A0A7Y0L757_9FIRM|nr:restriction endonuclease subunit S [Sulfobacillus harzensis]NMP24268.1 hypothetical protein [Sulfobacillus harzensis]